MSSYYVELDRPGEDGLSRPADAPLSCPDEGENGALVTAEQAMTVADDLDHGLTVGRLKNARMHFGEHTTEMIREFIAFLRRGAFTVVRTSY
jgi:hypothetical protein